MVLKKLKVTPNGVKEVDLTADDINQQNADITEHNQKKPMRDWLRDMAQLDKLMSGRVVEDILDYIVNGS